MVRTPALEKARSHVLAAILLMLVAALSCCDHEKPATTPKPPAEQNAPNGNDISGHHDQSSQADSFTLYTQTSENGINWITWGNAVLDNAKSVQVGFFTNNSDRLSVATITERDAVEECLLWVKPYLKGALNRHPKHPLHMATNPLPFIEFYSDSSQNPDSLIARVPLIWGVFGSDRDRIPREFTQKIKRIGTK